jgi:hypothetical protein
MAMYGKWRIGRFLPYHRLAAEGIYPPDWGSDPVDEAEAINCGE